MEDVLDLSALELSGMLERRELSVPELVGLTLDRIEAVNPAVNAIVSLRDRSPLLAEAMVANRSPRRGWLHGIPVAVKDLVATEGIATSYGSAIFEDFVPAADDLLARRLKDAGAILIGKTNVPEMGLGSHSYNPVHGVTRNPYDPSRSAGGSSGGAAAALATRMVSVADGSDMMGSLRNPAGWNNVYGHRPTHGLVPGDPVGEMVLHPLSTNGPMARCPRDLAALLEVLAGPDPLQPVGAVFEAGDLAADLRGRRIGWLGDWGGAWPVEPGILELCEGALRVFADLGCAVEPLAPPFSADALWESWVTLRHWAVAGKHGALYDDPEARALMKPELVWEIERGRALANADILAASALRSEWYRAAARMFQSYDAVAMPTAQLWPFPAEWDWPKEIAGQGMDSYHRWMECVVPVSLIGLPCTALPAGFGAQGLPGGLQLAGPRGADRALLQMAEAYHGATDWPGARPPPI
ncbi:amidase [Psychromarinibacter sp. C21-152]|uniref:Amidase n=1 Tax=Psychromarinibacter sediminicola TaxID=3033385 RepID=A0AAE3T778_9RHOB|nr:amidase [Psychromarinibacter sediminicola]MDF0600050.1 amidase [Psychromarinibacter sediminicola]